MNASLRHRLSIHQARTRDEVLDAVTAYFSSLPSEQLVMLPAQLRAPGPWGPDRLSIDIPDGNDHGKEARMLQEVRSLLSLASLRLDIIAMEAGRTPG